MVVVKHSPTMPAEKRNQPPINGRFRYWHTINPTYPQSSNLLRINGIMLPNNICYIV